MQRFVTRVAISLVTVVFILCRAVSSAQAPDPVVGTWKLNLAKLKYATPDPKSTTVTFAPAANGDAVTVDAIGPNREPRKWGYTSSFDGAESAVFGHAGIDAVVARTTGTAGTVTIPFGR